MKGSRAIAAGLGFSVLFLYLALRQVRLADLAAAFLHARPAAVAALLALIAIDPVVRAARWRLLLPRSREATAMKLFKLEAIGLAFNNLLPGRAGEFVRAFLASRDLGAPLLTVLASIVVERLFDALAMLGLLLFAGDWSAAPGARVWARAGFAALIAVLAGVAWLERSGRLSFERLPPKAAEFARQLALGARSLSDAPAALAVSGLSAALWLLAGAQFDAAGRGLAISSMSYPLGVSAMCAAAASTIIPAAPGYFGTWEFAVKSVLVRAGAGEAQAIGMAGLLHMMQFSVIVVLGLVFLYQEGHTLSSLAGLARSPEPEAARP